MTKVITQVGAENWPIKWSPLEKIKSNAPDMIVVFTIEMVTFPLDAFNMFGWPQSASRAK